MYNVIYRYMINVNIISKQNFSNRIIISVISLASAIIVSQFMSTGRVEAAVCRDDPSRLSARVLLVSLDS